MGSLEPKSDQTFSVMEPEVASGNRGATPSEVTPATSSSDDASKSRTDFPFGSMPTINEELSDGSATEFPPTQVMHRASESPLPDPHRIPPHVFDRTKSTAPVEWSVASNESLFSIQMGNMSFTNEQFSWMNKSGELGLTGDGQFLGDIPYSPALPPVLVNKSPESNVKNDNFNQGLGVTEAAAAETMREVIRENASDNNNQEKLPPPKAVSPRKADPRAVSTKRSDDSSIKSFAFPILTGDGNKSRSMSINHEKKQKQHSQPSSPKPASEPETPGAMSEPVTPKENTPKATTKNVGLGKWLSCFSCCPFCS